MNLQIDSGVPMPEKQGKRGKWQDVASQMKVGDSVFFSDTRSTDNEPRSLRTAAVSLGMKLKFFAIDGGVRVWRIE